MPTEPNNHGKRWTTHDIAQLNQLAQGNTPTRVAALKLRRTPNAVQSKASELGIPLAPTNQRPYTAGGQSRW